MADNPFVRKLMHGADLSDIDKAALNKAATTVRELRPRTDVIRQGDKPDEVHVVLEGFAVRHKDVSDGARQIMAYLVPGDMCDLHVAILGEMDHSITTVGSARVAYIAKSTIHELTASYPRINRALWWATLVDEGVLREWLVNMGRREADQRMAHLFCELLARLKAVGLATDNTFELPVTQEDLGNTLGITTVHVNRMLQQLRASGLLTLKGKALTILNVEGLETFADFDPAYLHLNNGKERLASETAA